MGDRTQNARPESNVYTIMVILSVAMLLGSTVYLAMRSQSLFGSWNPF